jgi:hypothetical protein
MDVDLDGATWRKSTYSNGSGGNCVEVADLPNGRAVRDFKHPEGPVLVFTRDQWRAFVQGIEAGELGAELHSARASGRHLSEGPRHDPHSLVAVRSDDILVMVGGGGLAVAGLGFSLSVWVAPVGLRAG